MAGDCWNGGEPLEAFFDAVPCGLLSVAPDRTILAANQTFLGWLGYERDAVVGARRLDELLTVASRLYYETHHAPLVRMQGFAREIAADFVCRDGRIMPAFVDTMEKRGPEGEVELLRIAVFAAANRRTYERELLLGQRKAQQALQAKADFLAMFAHEIRNPVGALRMQAEMLQRQLPEQQQPGITRLRGSVERLMGLLDNMLSISKLDAGKVSLDETEFELATVLQAVVHTMGPLADKKSLPVRIRLDPALPPRFLGDPVKLDQALTNLVGNAIKFTERGAITIGADRIGGAEDTVAVRLSVEDTGIGIPPERQSAIFEEYVQADRTTGPRYGGTGLGLAITRKLVELQGGRLVLRSEPGLGSTFSFVIPMKVRAPVADRV